MPRFVQGPKPAGVVVRSDFGRRLRTTLLVTLTLWIFAAMAIFGLVSGSTEKWPNNLLIIALAAVTTWIMARWVKRGRAVAGAPVESAGPAVIDLSGSDASDSDVSGSDDE